MQPTYHLVNMRTIAPLLIHAIDPKARAGMAIWKVTRAGGGKIE